jgi:hypothetical protein
MGSMFPGQDPPPPASTQAAARIEGPIEDSPGSGPFIMSCATLQGDTVMNRNDEHLGKLDHIMIDVPSGTLAYAVLACGGVFGIGERLHAIPWDALALDGARKCFVLDIDKDRLDAAPGFDRDHWPAMADAQWAADVHNYYQVPPYWAGREARYSMGRQT